MKATYIREMPLSEKERERLKRFPFSSHIADPLCINLNSISCRITGPEKSVQLEATSYGLPWTHQKRKKALNTRLRQCSEFIAEAPPSLLPHECSPFRICTWTSAEECIRAGWGLLFCCLAAFLAIFSWTWVMGVQVMDHWFDTQIHFAETLSALGFEPVLPADYLRSQPFSTRIASGLFYAISLGTACSLLLIPVYLLLEFSTVFARITSPVLFITGLVLLRYAPPEPTAVPVMSVVTPFIGFFAYSLVWSRRNHSTEFP